MNCTIFQPKRGQNRLKIFIPYQRESIRKQIKELPDAWYHPEQKLWSVLNTKENDRLLKEIMGGRFTLAVSVEKPALPVRKLSPEALVAIDGLESKLLLKGYSSSTVHTYKSNFTQFLVYFDGRNLRDITKDEIEGYVTMLIRKHGISETKQNQMINAIKAFYEHVLGLPRTFYDLQRPKKRITLPNVLSREEVKTLIHAPDKFETSNHAPGDL